MSDPSQAEYQALRDTIRERGTARLCAVLGGLVAWGALAMALVIAELKAARRPGALRSSLSRTFEINFFIHTGVERVGRYLQVFYEERAGATGWETIAMSYGAKFPPDSIRCSRSSSLPRPPEFLSCSRWPSAARMDRALARSHISHSVTESSPQEDSQARNARSISIASEVSYPSNWFRAPNLLTSWSDTTLPKKSQRGRRRRSRNLFGNVRAIDGSSLCVLTAIRICHGYGKCFSAARRPVWEVLFGSSDSPRSAAAASSVVTASSPPTGT